MTKENGDEDNDINESVDNSEAEQETTKNNIDDTQAEIKNDEKVQKVLNNKFKKFFSFIKKHIVMITMLIFVFVGFYIVNFSLKDSVSRYFDWLYSGSPSPTIYGRNYYNYNYNTQDTDDEDDANTYINPITYLDYDTELSLTDKEVWYDEKVTVASSDIFDFGEDFSNEEYMGDAYIIGERGDNKIIYALFPGITRGDSRIYEKKPDGSLTYVCFPIDADDVYSKQCSSDQRFDNVTKYSSTLHYDSLGATAPVSFDFIGGYLEYQNEGSIGYYQVSDDDDYEVTFIADVSAGKLYSIKTTDLDSGIYEVRYYIETIIGTILDLDYDPLPQSLSGYDWYIGEGDVSGSSIHNIKHDCSTMSYLGVSKYDFLKSDLTLAGISSSNKKVYAITNLDNPVLKEIYDDYLDKYDMYIKQSGASKLSIQEFVDQHGIVIFGEPDGSWDIFNRTDLVVVGGCGKPVIYLYPEEKTDVSVTVDANVTVSIPTYNPKTGWKATAEPSGKLIVDGVEYDSLFWEGFGNGPYPAIKEGTVVEKKDAAVTIRRQLAEQGLIQKEIDDFMEFWEGKIPNKKYIRLTWFNTTQMDRLAPLQVKPRPDTVIRVFLDMKGFDEKIYMPTQKLTKIERNGFTLIEWGGLIKN